MSIEAAVRQTCLGHQCRDADAVDAMLPEHSRRDLDDVFAVLIRFLARYAGHFSFSFS
jgi:hypothetical protein